MTETIKTIITADGSAHAAAFRAAADVVNNYQAKEKAAASKAVETLQGQINALRMQAGGYENLANSMRATQALQEQAARIAASGAVTEEKAIALLRERQTLQQAIAAQQARAARIANPGALGLPGGEMAPLTPQTLALIDRTVASNRELRRQTLLAGQSGKAGSLGFLAFSQAVEDAQYGIRGVLNNIPQMIMGFGGTAGLAGVLSLTAVAAAALYPQLKRLYGVTDAETIKASADEWAKVFKAGLESANEFERAARAEREMARYGEQIAAALEARFSISRQMAGYYDEGLVAARAERDAVLDLLRARLQLEQARGGTGFTIAAQIRDEQGAGMQADLENRRREMARINEDLARLDETLANASAESAAAQVAATERIAEAKRNLAGAQANLAAAEAKAKDRNGRSYETAAADREVATAKALVQQRERDIAAMEQSIGISQQKYAEEIAKLQQSITALNQKNNLTYQESQELERQIALRKQLQTVEQSTDAASNWNAWQEAIRKAAETSRRASRQSAEDGRALMAQAKMDPAQAGARQNFREELMVLDLQLNGRMKIADALKEELDLRRRARDLAVETNLSNQRAIEILRREKQIKDSIQAAGKGLRDRATDRQEARDLAREERKRTARILNDRDNPLRPEMLRRREEERRNRAVRERQLEPKQDASQKLLEDQFNIQTEIRDALKKLGLV